MRAGDRTTTDDDEGSAACRSQIRMPVVVGAAYQRPPAASIDQRTDGKSPNVIFAEPGGDVCKSSNAVPRSPASACGPMKLGGTTHQRPELVNWGQRMPATLVSMLHETGLPRPSPTAENSRPNSWVSRQEATIGTEDHSVWIDPACVQRILTGRRLGGWLFRRGRRSRGGVRRRLVETASVAATAGGTRNELTSHSLMVWSRLPLANVLPSGAKATLQISSGCPWMISRLRP